MKPGEKFIVFFKKKISNVYLFLRESEYIGEGQRERETESEAGSRLWAVSTEPDAGLELKSHEIMTWAEVGYLTHWATQAPPPLFVIKWLWEEKNLQRTYL